MAAEPSGDLQGAALARELRRRIPGVELLGVGCARLREAGVKLIWDSSTWGTIGPSEAIARLPGYYMAYRRMRHVLVREQPELTVVIDSPAIHMRLTGYLQRQSMRTLYYFPPSAWTRNPKRVHAIHCRVCGVVATFALNYQTYCDNGLPVAYYGHPMVDLLACAPSPAESRRALGLPEGRYIALMPGSRLAEVRLLTPILLETARRLREHRPDLRFLLPAASAKIEKRLRRLIGPIPEWLTLVSGSSREVLRCSELVLMCSGSASLEAAVLGIPLAIFYKLNRADYALARLLRWLNILRIDRFALPNLVLDEDALPELVQDQVTPERLEQEALRLLEPGPYRQEHLDTLARVRQALAGQGSIPKIAAFVDYVAQGFESLEALEKVDQEFA
ncbi:MAG: lipid-A-disaccharide synthase [Candidatus Eremiobacteraeota bacterium]|nr:lipid-A-disaccharide synthase [Candidatus Eremiobacteraeota bacterium]